MKKATFILTVLFSIIFFRWIVYMNDLEKSLKSKKNNELTQVVDTLVVEKLDANIFYSIDSISKFDCNDSLVVCFINKLNIQHPNIVYAQMRLESGNYKSNLANNNNNYFGMKQPKCRNTLSIGETNGYATYESWVHSIIDYALWQKRYAYNLSEQEYYEKLSSYASDKDYISKVKQISKTYYEKVKN